MEDSMITIKFELTDEHNEHYEASSTFQVFHSLGESEVDCIGMKLNVFLRQAGYLRRNDNIFMEDVTDEEYDAIADFLDGYRNKRLSESNE